MRLVCLYLSCNFNRMTLSYLVLGVRFVVALRNEIVVAFVAFVVGVAVVLDPLVAFHSLIHWPVVVVVVEDRASHVLATIFDCSRYLIEPQQSERVPRVSRSYQSHLPSQGNDAESDIRK